MKREQETGSYWPEHTLRDRLLVADNAKVDDALALHSKFGAVGVAIDLADEMQIESQHIVATRCTHDYTPGSVVAKLKNNWIIALTDGLMRVDAPL